MSLTPKQHLTKIKGHFLREEHCKEKYLTQWSVGVVGGQSSQPKDITARVCLGSDLGLNTSIMGNGDVY